MSNEYISLEQSPPLKGSVPLVGAKNAVLVIMASLILTKGKNRLTNVPFSEDVKHMIRLLELLGAQIEQDKSINSLVIDTTDLFLVPIGDDIMRKMRASILVLGPLLARFLSAQVALPGGCVLGARPIDYHLSAFKKMGVKFHQSAEYLSAEVENLQAVEHVLSYPSVGATENIMMASVLTQGTTRIINAALEPEVFDLITVLKKMGALIEVVPPATIEITGVKVLSSVNHTIMFDRLEAGTLILATAITGGHLVLPDAPASSMTVFLSLLEDMGHSITVGPAGIGISFRATATPKAISFKTMPYPGFPTDLQAPMMAVLCRCSGTSTVNETVFENRFMHIRELEKMGAQITQSGQVATVIGVDELYGASVIATDIRAGAALLIAGLAAQGTTTLTGITHLTRGYDNIVSKLASLGGLISHKQ